MKRSKIFLLAFAFAMSTTIYAAPNKIKDLDALSVKIENLLRDCNQTIEEGISVTVFFSVSEDNKIQYIAVAATDPVLCTDLQKRLKNLKLDGNKWRKGVIYELSVGHADAPPVLANL